MNTLDRSLRARTGFFLLTALAVWLGCALVGALLVPLASTALGSAHSKAESVATGVRYLGGLGLYAGLQIATVRLIRREGRAEAAKRWRGHFVDFHVSIVGICALGALLGALLFPVIGGLGGSYRSASELILTGAKMGGFYFMVWAPGAALVREFFRA
jgi:hypothetical protein